MRKLALAALAAIGALGASQMISVTPAEAAVHYPYCIAGAQNGHPGDCNYRSFADCRRTARHTGGSCVRNPRYSYGKYRSHRHMMYRHMR